MPNISDSIERLKREVADLRKTVDEQGIRLTLAQAWIDLYQHAYQALLSHGVNFMSLPSFQDTSVLDEAEDMPVSQARNHIVRYLGRLKSDISAAVRRKGFTVH